MLSANSPFGCRLVRTSKAPPESPHSLQRNFIQFRFNLLSKFIEFSYENYPVDTKKFRRTIRFVWSPLHFRLFAELSHLFRCHFEAVAVLYGALG